MLDAHHDVCRSYTAGLYFQRRSSYGLAVFFHIGKPKSIADLPESSGQSPKLSHVQMLLIDDSDFPYLENLATHDFNIRQYRDVTDLKSVEPYPVVLCDIRGVGRQLSERFEGAHVIQEIRKRYPAKVVVAYSGESFGR